MLERLKGTKVASVLTCLVCGEETKVRLFFEIFLWVVECVYSFFFGGGVKRPLNLPLDPYFGALFL